MNNEFKKSSSGIITRYVLESDGGTTGSSSVGSGSISMPMGGVQRRQGDNLIAQEANKKVEPPKPRNFVAKNAKMGGAGQHKDKKKAEKQGDVKHKKPFMEGAVKDLSTDLRSMPDAEFVAKYKKSKAEAREAMKNVSEGEDHEIQMASSELMSIAKNAEALLDMVRKYSEKEGLDAWQQSKITKAADYLNAVLQAVSGEQNAMEDHSTATGGWGQGSYDAYSVARHGRGVAEAGMPSSVVKSKQRYAAMSDKDFHAAHKDKSEDDLKGMAWRHGYGKGSTHYIDKHKKGQEQSVAEADMGRRGFLKGLGAAALGATALGAAGKAQANQDQNLGNGFVLTTVDALGGKFKAVLDTQSDIHYLPNHREGGGAIVRSMAPFITIKNGQINTTMSVGPATQAAMKKAGLLKGVEEGVAETSKYNSTDDKVGFSVNSEKAYNAVMHKFGDYIDHDEASGTMYVPEKLWPRVEEVAFDADGEGAARDDGDQYQEGDSYMMELAAKLAEKIPKNAPVDVWIKDFEKSNAPQFRGKNLAKRKQMAIAASYSAKNPSKKK